ncbi:hypothetical protein VST7929_03023 [Vibrio stylophorae]|uniref:SGNH hydrolase-type esterase domain-containing protein n=1 Tax=Vibrio stylophorae TaxID=659351 RepID=A0ABM8ZXT8_9VIBR|nr:GDSL-type esterase/lipase family protein [Vibrio stylophorae]CAH0535449.1 hypothetical protein VST7929_03023 [Vibrio stylophorae]
MEKDQLIILFGDSLTEWGQWHEQFGSVSLVNLGIAGDTVANMRHRMHRVPALKPARVLVMAGINDLIQGASVMRVIEHYDEILKYWHAQGLAVHVQSVLYCGAQFDALNEQVTLLNEGLAELARRYHFQYVDVASNLCPQKVLNARHTYDGVHLTPSAYTLWAQDIAPLVRQRVTA